MKKLYLLGHPVSHSLSPLMQNAAIQHFGLDWRYETLDVLPEDLILTLERLEADENVIGCNVTVPHKVAVYEWLIAGNRRIYTYAQYAKAVNTLVRQPDGKFGGDSTDFQGARDALLKNGLGISPNPNRNLDRILTEFDIAILGTGGSAQTLAFGFAQDNTLPRSLTIFGRDVEKARNLAREVRNRSPAVGLGDIEAPIPTTARDLSEFPDWVPSGRSIVIQTTTVGLSTGNDAGRTPVPTGSVGMDQIAFDLVYKPHDTLFLMDAAKNGATVVHGINMLLGQGVLSLQRWMNAYDSGIFDFNMTADVMRSALGV
jgi:shikimate dehydrogenase